MSLFSSLEMLPEDPILSLAQAYVDDPRIKKVNLGIGAYKTDEGLPFVLSCVRKAEANLLEQKLDKEYIPIVGDLEFVKSCLEVLLGAQSTAVKENRIAALQTVGGSGALRLLGELLKVSQAGTLYLSDPSWPNHRGIFSRTGLSIGSYPYYNSVTHQLDFYQMCEAAKKMQRNDVMLLHACCHNPTGVDLTMEQWKELIPILHQRGVIPLIDVAYQGFGDGIEEDAMPLRYLVEQGGPVLITYSFSKNLGLYGERIGMLAAVMESKETADRVRSQLKVLVRGNYSSPPFHGARIVKTVLRSPELRKEWLDELRMMRNRVEEMRQGLAAGLLAGGSTFDFSFLYHQKGIFSFCGLTAEQVARLREDYGFYMPSNGRINVAGLNHHNLKYVVDSILAVL